MLNMVRHGVEADVELNNQMCRMSCFKHQYYKVLLQVTKAHAGDYTCTPYNTHGTSGTSGVMQVGR